MSADLERIKKLVNMDQVVAAVEVPSGHRTKAHVADDLEEVLSRFDDDVDYAHFVVRVKRTTQPLPRPMEEPQAPQLSIDSLVNETMEMSERIAESRANAESTEKIVAENDPAFLLENAKLLEEHNELELARNIYNAMVRKGLLIPQGLAGMARTYEKLGENEKAIRCYEEAIAYSSELPFYQAVAALHIRIGDDEAAAQSILHALGLPNLAEDQKFELHKSLGNCYTRLADYPKAEHHYRKAYELNANSDILQVNVGSLALQKSDYESALKHFQKALELNPRNDKAISGMGMVYLGKGDPAKAHEYFVSGLRLNINNLGAIYNLVKCAYDIKRFEDAALILKRYIETNPVNTNILYSYAGILFHHGEYRLAMNEVQKILETNPVHSGATELKELIEQKLTTQ